MPNIKPSASWMTRPNILDDVSGLSPEAIEALPAEEGITFTTRRLWLRGAVAPRLGESKATAGTRLWQSETYGHDA